MRKNLEARIHDLEAALAERVKPSKELKEKNEIIRKIKGTAVDRAPLIVLRRSSPGYSCVRSQGS
jgi:hypothetical protein